MAFDLFQAVKDKAVKVEEVIAEKGGKLPHVCAASGRKLVQPWITYHLGNTHYFRVMARFQSQWVWDEAQQKKMEALIPRTMKVSKETEVKS